MASETDLIRPFDPLPPSFPTGPEPSLTPYDPLPPSQAQPRSGGPGGGEDLNGYWAPAPWNSGGSGNTMPNNPWTALPQSLTPNQSPNGFTSPSNGYTAPSNTAASGNGNFPAQSIVQPNPTPLPTALPGAPSQNAPPTLASPALTSVTKDPGPPGQSVPSVSPPLSLLQSDAAGLPNLNGINWQQILQAILPSLQSLLARQMGNPIFGQR